MIFIYPACPPPPCISPTPPCMSPSLSLHLGAPYVFDSLFHNVLCANMSYFNEISGEIQISLIYCIILLFIASIFLSNCMMACIVLTDIYVDTLYRFIVEELFLH